MHEWGGQQKIGGTIIAVVVGFVLLVIIFEKKK
jgi:hypothetical protein